ncbi:MAG: DUF169 domain-containing protein [Syntrophomonadaceae bacterium]|nr:DUF169 domain-containing protein [Syntrophomonadaceae bacterium]MDD3023393.1 DUF169 domain-containing protein [Syntrophomonadaceae bacterium]
MEYFNYSRSLKYFLELYRQPVAVRFLPQGENEPEGFKSELKLTFCQFVMLAQSGDMLIATADNVACANGAAALGLRPLPEKIRKGEMHTQLNVYGSLDAAAQVSALTPRLPQGSYSKILLSPLDSSPFEPDIVILQGPPAQLMWIVIADNYDNGERYSFSTAVSQGVCVDVSIVPFLTGKLNLSIGCYGSRGATDQKADEILLGVPFARLARIIDLLPELKGSIMKRTNEQGSYKRLQEKLNS